MLDFFFYLRGMVKIDQLLWQITLTQNLAATVKLSVFKLFLLKLHNSVIKQCGNSQNMHKTFFNFSKKKKIVTWSINKIGEKKLYEDVLHHDLLHIDLFGITKLLTSFPYIAGDEQLLELKPVNFLKKVLVGEWRQ